jgi:aconitate hydratase
MIICTTLESKQTKICRGPNIGDPPKNKPLSKNINGKIAIKVGDEITTDHIMPAGSRLKYRSNIKKYSQFVFEGIEPFFSKRCQDNKSAGYDNIIVAGLSYGQGSSREHAAMCPMYLGVKAVLAKSFARIHQANLINNGIIPLVFENPKDYDDIEEIKELLIEDAISQVKGKTIKVRNLTKNKEYRMILDITPRQREMLIQGGLLNLIRLKENIND